MPGKNETRAIADIAKLVENARENRTGTAEADKEVYLAMCLEQIAFHIGKMIYEESPMPMVAATVHNLPQKIAAIAYASMKKGIKGEKEVGEEPGRSIMGGEVSPADVMGLKE